MDQINDTKLKLVPFTINDIDQLSSWIKSPKALLQFAGPQLSFPINKDQFIAIIQDPKQIAFSFCFNDLIIGHGQILITDDHFLLRRIIIGQQEFRSRGLGKILVQQLTHYGFEQTNLEMAQLNVYDWNISAIKCYEKIGFEILHGVSKKTIYNNESWTSIRMTISKDKFYSINDFN